MKNNLIPGNVLHMLASLFWIMLLYYRISSRNIFKNIFSIKCWGLIHRLLNELVHPPCILVERRECILPLPSHFIPSPLHLPFHASFFPPLSVSYPTLLPHSPFLPLLPLHSDSLSNNPSIFAQEWRSNAFHLCVLLVGLQGQGLPLFIHSPSPLQLLSNKTPESGSTQL